MRMPPASFLALSFLLSTTAVQAQSPLASPAFAFSGSGFLTLGAGRMLGGHRDDVGNRECPCYPVDYGQGGIYDGRGGLQWGPDSKLGLQGTASLTGTDLSVTAQAVMRGARDGKTNLEWLYASYRLNERITLQAGRKRLPMFYYSDIQDVGFALPWTHLPPAVYGWEAVNYDGLNLLYQDHWGGWSSTLNLLAGGEHRKESGYYKITDGRRNRTDVKWDNIAGGDLTLAKDWFEARLVYIQSHTRKKSVTGYWDRGLGDLDSATIDADFGPAARQKIHGIALNADWRDWLVRGEFIYISHPGLNYRDYAQQVAVGHRLGRWQPTLTWTRYKQGAVLDQGADPAAMEAWTVRTFTLRYDLTGTSALKVQFDDKREQSGPDYAYRFGNSRLLTFTYDRVF
ncbi:MAG: hypothetical protein OHM77_02465 [Candidatus Nitricoxidivorans perseverans]|uniref:Porin n=1 Tax=Candidatus Nitricoxidivorans perseverans TaxID=2975601 RepID=A0AA49IWL7_9PROT|nr:MAG: hypothetical protein OHM77_02465 [Candidatus Nitricoxidivorans perseverans]